MSDFTFSKWAEKIYGKRIHGPGKEDKVWSIKHEGHLNRNNIIFKDRKIKDMVDSIKDAGPKPVKQTVTNLSLIHI